MGEQHLHLLHLPRELRNHIYCYLYHDIEFEWRWNYWPLSGADGIAAVCLEDAHYLTLLLTCRQIHNEYLASTRGRALTITLKVCLGGEDFYRREDSRYRGLIDQLLPRIGRLNILMCNRRPGDNMARHFWFEIYLLSQALRDRLPRMTMLQITAYAPPPSPNKEPREQLVRNELHSRALVLPPSELVNGFSLLRHTEACCQGYNDEILSSMANEDLFHIGTAKRNPSFQGVMLMGEWLYASSNTEL
tara:strand:+ start:2367 stop:3107 length:741 start_codon:yes stop_codon:yes gene_type:complete